MEKTNHPQKEIYHFSVEYCPTGVFEQTENYHDEPFLRDDANSADVLHLLGGIAYASGQFFDAIKFIKKAIENDSTKSEFYHDLGAAYYETGDLNKAIKAFRRALCLNPGSAEINKNLGLTLYSMGNLDGAVEAFQRAVAASPDATEFHYLSGNLFDGNPRKAVDGCQDMITLSSLNLDIYLKLGNSLHELGKSNEAIDAYESALAIDPNCTEAYLYLGNIYKMQKKLGKAVAAYRRAIHIRPNFAEAYHNLGAALVALNRSEDAIRSFSCAAYLDPSDVSAKYLLNALTVRTVKRAPAQYVKNLFDQYSTSYETHMVKELGYRVPELFRKLLRPLTNNGHFFQYALDLGCGTGLSGVAIRSVSKRLIGLDLSPKMISEARKKNLYDQLIVGEITEFLKEGKAKFDLVVAGDVLIYFGDLKPVFHFVKNRLSHGAYFLFTTESTEENDRVLSETGRFSHSKAYVLNLAKMNGFVIKGYKSTKIRKEKEGWAKGDVYLLKYI